MYSFLADSLRSRQAVLIWFYSIFQGITANWTRISFNPCLYLWDGRCCFGGTGMVSSASRFLFIDMVFTRGFAMNYGFRRANPSTWVTSSAIGACGYSAVPFREAHEMYNKSCFFYLERVILFSPCVDNWLWNCVFATASAHGD